jgi:hypothetical protein
VADVNTVIKVKTQNQFPVESIARVSRRAPLQMCALVGMSVGTFSRREVEAEEKIDPRDNITERTTIEWTGLESENLDPLQRNGRKLGTREREGETRKVCGASSQRKLGRCPVLPTK